MGKLGFSVIEQFELIVMIVMEKEKRSLFDYSPRRNTKD